MEKKVRILGWLDQIDRLELDLAGKLSAEQREASGTLEQWGAKVDLAHSAAWLERLLDNLERAERGEEITNYDAFLEINDRDFEGFAKLSWDEASERSRAARQRLRGVLARLDEAALDDREMLPSERPRPLWQRFVDNAVEHPIYHLSLVFNRTGEAQRFTEVEEQILDELAELDPENTEWQGVLRYNLACQYALSGRKEDAVNALKTALRLNPGLTEWSKEDPDFVSLREDSEYLAIYTE